MEQENQTPLIGASLRVSLLSIVESTIVEKAVHMKLSEEQMNISRKRCETYT